MKIGQKAITSTTETKRTKKKEQHNTQTKYIS